MPPPDLIAALAHGLDRVAFCRDRLDFEPDDWQRLFLSSDRRRKILNCGRQVGKSTVVSARAVHKALYTPGSLTLVIAPSQRQSRELSIKIAGFLDRLEPTPTLTEDNKLSLTLASGSRIVALPGDANTIRGYSAPDLILVDEAAYVAAATFTALLPMQASNPTSELVLLSTPNARSGFFYEAWISGSDWERFQVPSRECPRISAAWLEERRRENPLDFPREYECEFVSGSDSIFPDSLLDSLLADDFEPLAAA